MRKRVKVDMVAFRRDVELGTTPLVLADKYGISKPTVWRLKAEISGKIARRELGDMPPEESAEAVVDLYEMKLDLPTARINDFLEALSLDELRNAVMGMGDQDKAYIIQLALQQRLNPSPKTETSDNAQTGPDPS